MGERPIIMAAESVRAILGGRKTQSRRVLRERDVERLGLGLVGIAARIAPEIRPAPIVYSGCPYGEPGDRLWVREGFRLHRWCDDEKVTPSERLGVRPWYDADGEPPKDPVSSGGLALQPWGKRRPGIHLPRWASRLTLEILSVRVERVQAISPDDAIAEGVERVPRCGCEVCARLGPGQWCPADAGAQVQLFAEAWDVINGRRAGCSWADNPWCWCLSFRRVEAT